MSLVRYVNKKTGWVSIYESTSCYDPIKKTSRPKRKYIGYEDPVTKEFVPSSGKPGRKRKSESEKATYSVSHMPDDTYYGKYKQAIEELNSQRNENKMLREQILSLQRQFEELNKAVDRFIHSVQSTRN